MNALSIGDSVLIDVFETSGKEGGDGYMKPFDGVEVLERSVDVSFFELEILLPNSLRPDWLLE